MALSHVIGWTLGSICNNFVMSLTNQNQIQIWWMSRAVLSTVSVIHTYNILFATVFSSAWICVISCRQYNWPVLFRYLSQPFQHLSLLGKFRSQNLFSAVQLLVLLLDLGHMEPGLQIKCQITYFFLSRLVYDFWRRKKSMQTNVITLLWWIILFLPSVV